MISEDLLFEVFMEKKSPRAVFFGIIVELVCHGLLTSQLYFSDRVLKEYGIHFSESCQVILD